LADRAWASLDEPDLAKSIEGLSLLCYLSERFSHPEGPTAHMRRLVTGSQRASDYLDHDDSTIPEQSSAYSLGTSLITVAAELSCASGIHPHIPSYVLGQFTAVKEVGSLPSPPFDLTPAFGTNVLDFVKLFNTLVVPLQAQALDIERLHSKDIIDPSVKTTEMLWAKVDEAQQYAEESLERILVDERMERDQDGYVTNQWT
ncbi:hypothetical protein P7C70_g8594, partial [Phenoliferia sp. Uapishka_3]